MGTIKNYINRPKVIQACQWFGPGDYPVEGVVTKYVKQDSTKDDPECTQCGGFWDRHGGMDTAEGYHRVCPGDYVCIGIEGEMYPCKPSIFEGSYDELAEDDPTDPQEIMRKNMESWGRHLR